MFRDIRPKIKGNLVKAVRISPCSSVLGEGRNCAARTIHQAPGRTTSEDYTFGSRVERTRLKVDGGENDIPSSVNLEKKIDCILLIFAVM